MDKNYRWFLELSYNGAPFFGWQIQPNASSVQETIENGLSTIFQSKIQITGCGRTDTGVHAHSYFAHFDTAKTFDHDQLVFRLNSLLPKSIGIRRCFNVPSELHARFDAKSRSYRYFVQFKKDPFKLPTSHYIYGTPPDIQRMNQAAKKLIGRSDFSAFEKSGSDNTNSICEITSAQWHPTSTGAYFEIAANRFLRNMVRAIVGTLLKVGNGQLSLIEFETIMDSKNRSKAGASAPAQGLFLWNIEYPNFKSYE